jgi:hypothetical protein
MHRCSTTDPGLFAAMPVLIKVWRLAIINQADLRPFKQHLNCVVERIAFLGGSHELIERVEPVRT